MSLINLRDEYITPEIDNLEQVLSTLLYTSLDESVDNKQIATLQDRLLSMCSLKEFISQHAHKTNSSDFIRTLYDKANSLGIDVTYHERKPITGQVAVKATSLQKERSKKRSESKAETKLKPKTNADISSVGRSPTIDTIDAEPDPKPKPAVPKIIKKLAPKLKPLAQPQAQEAQKDYYVWRTDKYGNKSGNNSGLIKKTLFNVFTKTADPSDIDTVMTIFARTTDPIDSQLSNKAALETSLGEPVSATVVSLHNRLKKAVKRD